MRRVSADARLAGVRCAPVRVNRGVALGRSGDGAAECEGHPVAPDGLRFPTVFRASGGGPASPRSPLEGTSSTHGRCDPTRVARMTWCRRTPRPRRFPGSGTAGVSVPGRADRPGRWAREPRSSDIRTPPGLSCRACVGGCGNITVTRRRWISVRNRPSPSAGRVAGRAPGGRRRGEALRVGAHTSGPVRAPGPGGPGTRVRHPEVSDRPSARMRAASPPRVISRGGEPSVFSVVAVARRAGVGRRLLG